MTVRSEKLRWVVAGSIAVVVLIGGGVWGVSAYRSAQVTKHAEGVAADLKASVAGVQKEAVAYQEQVDAVAVADQETFKPIADLVATHKSDFVEKSRTGFTGQRAKIAELVKMTPDADVTLPAPFDVSIAKDAVVDLYHEAGGHEREKFDGVRDAAVKELEQKAKDLATARAELERASTGLQRAGIELAASVPKAAAVVLKDNSRGTATAKEAQKKSSAVFASWSGTADDQLADRVADLLPTVKAYTTAADQLRASHQKAVTAAQRASGGGGNWTDGNWRFLGPANTFTPSWSW